MPERLLAPALRRDRAVASRARNEGGHHLRFSVDDMGSCCANHDHDQHQRTKVGEPWNEQPDCTEEFSDANGKVGEACC
jgi:hypothetical protein